MIKSLAVKRLYELLGERVKARRKAQELSQDQLAKQVDLTRTSISNIEAGRQHLPLHVLYRLAHCLQCRPHELLPEPEVLAESDEAASELAAKTKRTDLRDFLSTIDEAALAAKR